MVKNLPKDFQEERRIRVSYGSVDSNDTTELLELEEQISDVVPYCLVNEHLTRNLNSWNTMLRWTDKTIQIKNRLQVLPTGYKVKDSEGRYINERTWNAKSNENLLSALFMRHFASHL